MTALDFDRHRAEITTQASLLAGHLDDADVTVPVPSCPGWNVSQLCRHVDGGLRWANEIVATRAAEPPPQEALRDLSDATNADAAGIAVALREAAAALSATLHGAGPGAQMWCPVPGGGAAFYARRFAHEIAIHRADAALAMGIPFELDADVACDGVEEWLELGSLPFHFDVHRYVCCWPLLAGAGVTVARRGCRVLGRSGGRDSVPRIPGRWRFPVLLACGLSGRSGW
ncbi:MAG: hypothetical protein QOK12_1477 [Mycobacterium sp.]|nr:hypothetical protein [Mycobacterium sp.]